MEDVLQFTACFNDLVPSRPTEHLGDSDLSFGGKLSPALKIHEDGGESGCGGKVWIAGELLCEFLLEKSDQQGLFSQWNSDTRFQSPIKKIVELGSGTGLVGLCLGLLNKQNKLKDMDIYVTDIDQLVPLMDRNIKLNELEHVFPEELWWGEPLKPEFAPTRSNQRQIDLILAADCVYLEKAFPLLEVTLLDLTSCKDPPIILMSYKKRRKADKHFFKQIKKNFDVLEINEFTRFDHYLKQKTHLFQLVRKFK